MDVLVTILTPAYNRERYIEECIRSVQAQSLQNFEMLIIDDGSTDNTLNLCQKMAAEDHRIRLISGNHAGVSAARNTGLDVAKGKYIFFLDSDDVIHPLLLETLVQAMEQHNVPMGGTSGRLVSSGKWHMVQQALSKAGTPGTTQLKAFDVAIHEVFRGGTPFGYIGGVIIRRDWIGDTRFKTDLFIGEDFYFIYENLIKGADAVFLEELWYFVRLHDANLSKCCNYDGFMNRAYRRELVWKSEEALGRTENSRIQKNQVFGIYIKFIKDATISRTEKIKMRKGLRSYRKALMPALSLRNKLLFLLLCYCPIFEKPIVMLIRKKHKV